MRNVLQRSLLSVVRVLVSARGRYAHRPPSPTQTIYFANHSSHVDTLAILAALPPDVRAHVRPVAARDYWDATPVRRFIANRVLGVVYVTRHGAAGEDPLRAVRDALAQRWSIIIFPEGTRSETGEIGGFKSGLYWLSHDFPGVQLVPVHLSDLARAMPKGKPLPVPFNCQVSFGEPIPCAAALDKATFLATAREAVVNLQQSAGG